ncbi:CUE domain-containing protein 2 [Acropora cervicornis]|uniref:CUE domain-containing protein 2 n=1 Tax=Acropora cervicornis TaxID=6130 RepID=A0AAD9V8D8_ACRCE|nr:CUE domain-containing protein 2 [Acropora cervicornis]
MEADVERELKQFLKDQVSSEALCSIDEIVLGYIANVLEQLGEDEQFDVDEFAEIMAAYIPGFDSLTKEEVCSWMLGLAEKLVYIRRSSDVAVVKEDKVSSESKVVGVLPSSSAEGRHHVGEESDRVLSLQQAKQVRSSSNTTASLDVNSTYREMKDDCVNSNKMENAEERGPNFPGMRLPWEYHEKVFDDKKVIEVTVSLDRNSLSLTIDRDEVSVLLEMFPEACSLEIEQCLNDANGNTEAAVHLMLLKNGESCDDEGQESKLKIIDWSPKVRLPSANNLEERKADRESFKEQMMARYGYVDIRQDEITHQPRLNKQDNKKPLRYRDNQVVSTKGERFSLVKKQESEDMKKTYVNIKPARKYRFH